MGLGMRHEQNVCFFVFRNPILSSPIYSQKKKRTRK